MAVCSKYKLTRHYMIFHHNLMTYALTLVKLNIISLGKVSHLLL